MAILRYAKQDLINFLDISELLSHLKKYDLISDEDYETLSHSGTTKEQKIDWIIDELLEKQKGFLADLCAYVGRNSESDINCKKILQALQIAARNLKLSEFNSVLYYT